MKKKDFDNQSEFYSLEPILSKNATYNMIIGERSNGKTYAVLKYSLQQWWDGKGQVAIVRRWKEDITGRRASEIFSSLNANNELYKISKGKYQGVVYFAGRFFACNYDEDGKAIYNDQDVIGFCFALSEMEHNKSISYPYITTIMFDEFLTRQVYLNDEFVLFMNVISTIVRRRTDVKIFMLGNTVNKYSPYFKEMGLNHIFQMEQGSIDLYTYGTEGLTVAVEYCKAMTKSKQNNFYFAFNNPKLHMITNGAWELDIYPHCPYKYKPKDIIFVYFIVFNDRIFQCEIVDAKGEYFTFIHNKTTPLQDESKDLIYTLEYHYELNYSRNIRKPVNKLQERILWFYKTDRVFYQDNEVGDAISNYLKICGGVG